MGLLGGSALLSEGINEVIATTRNNAAPMGIIHRQDTLRMVLFQGSHTAKNVESEGWLVGNITYDPRIWVQSAFSDLGPEHFTEVKVEGIPMQRLAECEAWIAFSTEIEARSKESLVLRLTPEYEETRECSPHPVNRGFNNLIEATVHGTRYVRFHDPTLLVQIQHHATIVRKCGGEREREALEMLMGYIGMPVP